jgi:hypothetical protein
VNLPTSFDVLNLIGWNSSVVESFEIVYSSYGMKITSYDVDCCSGVSRCREFVCVAVWKSGGEQYKTCVEGQ